MSKLGQDLIASINEVIDWADGKLPKDACIVRSATKFKATPCIQAGNVTKTNKKSPLDVPGIDCKVGMEEILKDLRASREGRL